MTAEVVAALEQHLTGPSRMDAIEEELEKHKQLLDIVDVLYNVGGDLESAVIELQEQVFGGQRLPRVLK
ncbi:MAG: hypothetical protein M9932_02345 [Xanthobacteraceae bacterium]|nr:hypothetical protein [Xanthobacteraceae bacterium]